MPNKWLRLDWLFWVTVELFFFMIIILDIKGKYSVQILDVHFNLLASLSAIIIMIVYVYLITLEPGGASTFFALTGVLFGVGLILSTVNNGIEEFFDSRYTKVTDCVAIVTLLIHTIVLILVFVGLFSKPHKSMPTRQ